RFGELLGPAGLGNRDRYRVRLRLGRDLRSDPARAVAVVAAAQPHVFNATAGAAEQGHGSEDSRQPPLVLILDVAHRRPLVNAYAQQVAARPKGGRHVELLYQPAALAHTDLAAVQ